MVASGKALSLRAVGVTNTLISNHSGSSVCVCECVWEKERAREREHTQQTEYVRVNSHTNRRCDRLRYAHKGQMEVKGTRTPACQRNMHLAVNQWEMMCTRCPSCLICKRLFYANMSWRRSTHKAGEAPRPRCAEGGEEEQEINKNGHRITNGAFTQEVCLTVFARPLVPCSFFTLCCWIVSQDGTKVLCRHNERPNVSITQTQFGLRDSHCGVRLLCLWSKAASVVSPASCFKRHLAAPGSPSSHPAFSSSLSFTLVFIIYLCPFDLSHPRWVLLTPHLSALSSTGLQSQSTQQIQDMFSWSGIPELNIRLHSQRGQVYEGREITVWLKLNRCVSLWQANILVY